MPKSKSKSRKQKRYIHTSGSGFEPRKTLHSKTQKNRCKDDIGCEIKHFRKHKYPNQIWNTCIDVDGKIHHILYLTPKNVIIKSIDTYQIPTFVVRMEKTQVTCSFTFDGNYVSCFLRHCGSWYILLIQKNSMVYNDFLYYKIKHTKNVLNKDGELSFKLDMFMDTPNSPVLELKPEYLEEVSQRSPFWKVLQKFKFEKNIARDLKEIGALIVADTAFDAFI